MARKQKKTLAQHLSWWWDTRVMGLWRVKISGAKERKQLATKNKIQFNRDAEPMPSVSQGVTVILTAYRRAEYLIDQINALRAQTHPPKEIWVWSNRSEEDLIDVSEFADRVVVANSNFSFWGRFALAQLVRTEYVAFFDDDILPQPRWFENCLNTINQGFDGILGGSGVILPEEGGYSSKHKAGWNGKHLPHTVPVDLVGHAWFMRKKYVQYMWREEPITWENGEDIHLSYMALKHGGIKTFVPPHPESDTSLWSCRPDFGKMVGRMKVATYKTQDHRSVRSKIVDNYRNDGWKIAITQYDSSIYETKDFFRELSRFNQKLDQKINFSLVRFGDGEMVVINGDKIDLSEKYNGEHKYTPDEPSDERCRKILEESLLYQNPNYFVGLPCRCCVGDQHCDELRRQSKQPEQQLTWANLFVNANYPKFLDETLAVLKARTINIVCHNKAVIDQLPFPVKKDFRVGANAWVNDYDKTLKDMTEYIDANRIKDEVFLFCAGVLSNMLIYQLSKKFPENTYIDVGSVFDDMMQLGQTRKYLKGSRRRLKKVCIW